MENAPQELAEIAALRQLNPALAIRIASKYDIIGLLFIGAPLGREAFTAFERQVLRGVSAQFAMMLENARLMDRIVEQERLRRELQVASEVQKRLFPEGATETAAMKLTGICLPARGVGGDYYDFLALPEGRIGIALADVAGKGIAAALVMSIVQASLRSLASARTGSLAELAARMSHLLYRSTGPSSYATFFYAELDAEARQLHYVNGGHNAPYLLRQGGEIEELPAGGTIIGMFPASKYQEASVELSAGDVLLIFTDGVPEAQNPAEEEFGEERLQQALRCLAPLPAEQIAERLLAELRGWILDADQYDDLTFVVMKKSV